MDDKKKVMCVVGARPNFMKMAPAIRALESSPIISTILVHTGQHYDTAMSDSFMDQLRIKRPDYRLEVGSGSHATQTARILERIEPTLLKEHPDIMVVAGDVNSTLAAALAASKLGVPIAHIEAGLRSFDRCMPEEINRIIVDRISDILYTTEQSAHENLLREGVAEEKVVFVGNLMIDTLQASLGNAVSVSEQVTQIFGENDGPNIEGGYAVLTLHRPSNVDHPNILRGILSAIESIGRELPVLFPVHPRTRQRITALGRKVPSLYCMPPVGYFEMLGLISKSRVVLTDSGGIQEETTALGVPCLTLRENTERPITVEQGTNTVVGTKPDDIINAARAILRGNGKVGKIPPGWDGHAATRFAAHITQWLRDESNRGLRRG
jgi:UDP-N-acetylglucosamine 2-epimerase (non-hydrolysing)